MTAKILYVDDDAANRTVFRAAISPVFPVITAQSGAEALELIQQHEVAVLLTDQRMPAMTGTELAEEVKRSHPHTVRYLITAYADISAAIDAINRGQVRRYLRKPWNIDELLAALRDGMEDYETRRRLRELEQRMIEVERVYSLGVVAASIAHELRNPVFTLDASVQVLQEQVSRLLHGSHDDPMVARLGRTLERTHNAARLIADVLEGIELSTRRRVEAERVDVAEVLRLTLMLVGAAARARTRLETRVEAGDPVAWGSATRLGQVVLNLMTNAIEALPERPYEDNLVRVELTAAGQRLRLVVADNGNGIPPELVDRIFDPFFTTKQSGGTGLGLAISRQIVEEMGGTLQVDSAPGRGARFTMELPRAGDASPA